MYVGSDMGEGWVGGRDWGGWLSGDMGDVDGGSSAISWGCYHFWRWILNYEGS